MRPMKPTAPLKCSAASAIGRSAAVAALALGALFFSICPAAFAQAPLDSTNKFLIGKAAFGDWRMDAPLVRRRISVSDLPPPYASKSADNAPNVVTRPASAVPLVPPGFHVDLFVPNLHDPRVLRIA